MRKLLLTLFVGFFALTVNAQDVVNVTDDDGIERIFTKVEKEAQFPGGLNGWRIYLEKNLKGELAANYIKLPRKQKVAQQTVSIQFRVDKEGKISQVRAIHRPNEPEVHPALINEAVRVIRQGPDWIPAEQNNKKVIYQAIQNITFQVARD